MMTLDRAFRGRRREAGIAFVEVIIAAVVAAVAMLGVALMFAKGSAWVSAAGDNRVAMRLAQQKIEQLRSLGFNCIPVGGAPTSGTDPRMTTTAAGCTATQKYCEGGTTTTCIGGQGTAANSWVSATSHQVAAPQPTPTTRLYIRKTCVQYVSATDLNSPAYAGGTNPFAGNCAPGAATSVKRIVVVVQRSASTGGTTTTIPNPGLETEDPVVLESWVSSVPGGI